MKFLASLVVGGRGGLIASQHSSTGHVSLAPLTLYLPIIGGGGMKDLVSLAQTTSASLHATIVTLQLQYIVLAD